MRRSFDRRFSDLSRSITEPDRGKWTENRALTLCFFRFLRLAGPRGQSRASSIGYLRFASFGGGGIFPPLRCIRFECRFSDSAIFRFVKIIIFRKNKPFGCMDNTKRHASNRMMRVVLSCRRSFRPFRTMRMCSSSNFAPLRPECRQAGWRRNYIRSALLFRRPIWCSSGSFRPNRRGEAAIHRPSMPKRSCPKPLF